MVEKEEDGEYGGYGQPISRTFIKIFFSNIAPCKWLYKKKILQVL